jgi:hypothetical protein
MTIRGLTAALLVSAAALVPAELATASSGAPACCLYWTSNGGETIGRAQFGGPHGQPDFIRLQNPANGIAVDDEHIYWTATDQAGMAFLGRADLDGSHIDETLVSGLGSRPLSIAVQGGYVYWSEPLRDSIGRASLDGTSPDRNFISTSTPGPVAADDQHLYWASLSGPIGRAEIDGTGLLPDFITGADCPAGLSTDRARIYWTNFCRGSIGSAQLDGAGVDQESITGITEPWGLAVAQAGIFWTRFDTGAIGRAEFGGTVSDPDVIARAGANQLAIGPPGPIGTASAARRQQQVGDRIRIEVEVSAQQRLGARATGTVAVGATKRGEVDLITTPTTHPRTVGRDRSETLT